MKIIGERTLMAALLIILFTSTVSNAGTLDVIQADSSFDFPSGIGIDSTGNIYVSDSHNNAIYKVTPSAVVKTFAGTVGTWGDADGIGSEARFYEPDAITTDGAGNVYVADSRNDAIRKITPAGVVTTLAGTAGMEGNSDGTGAAARFFQPNGIATDSAGNIYVADACNHSIRKITPAGVVTTLVSNDGGMSCAEAGAD